jgi:hypothetical protein
MDETLAPISATVNNSVILRIFIPFLIEMSNFFRRMPQKPSPQIALRQQLRQAQVYVGIKNTGARDAVNVRINSRTKARTRWSSHKLGSFLERMRVDTLVNTQGTNQLRNWQKNR